MAATLITVSALALAASKLKDPLRSTNSPIFRTPDPATRMKFSFVAKSSVTPPIVSSIACPRPLNSTASDACIVTPLTPSSRATPLAFPAMPRLSIRKAPDASVSSTDTSPAWIMSVTSVAAALTTVLPPTVASSNMKSPDNDWSRMFIDTPVALTLRNGPAGTLTVTSSPSTSTVRVTAAEVVLICISTFPSAPALTSRRVRSNSAPICPARPAELIISRPPPSASLTIGEPGSPRASSTSLAAMATSPPRTSMKNTPLSFCPKTSSVAVGLGSIPSTTICRNGPPSTI